MAMHDDAMRKRRAWTGWMDGREWVAIETRATVLYHSLHRISSSRMLLGRCNRLWKQFGWRQAARKWWWKWCTVGVLREAINVRESSM